MPISYAVFCLQKNRYLPPTRRSTSQIGKVQPLWMPSQRVRSSGFVQASKTSSRGASNTRVIAISRSLGVVISSFAALAIMALPFSLRRLELVEQRVEPLVVAFPDLPVVLEPLRRVRERLALDPRRPALRLAAARDEPGALEHLQVLRHRRLRHREPLGQLRNGRIAGREPGEDRPAGRVRERRERRVEPPVGRSITGRLHN